MIHCIFHNADLDGKCSGAIVLRAHPDAHMIGTNYGDTFHVDDFASGDTVIIVDYSLPMAQMEALDKKCNLIWIDHHRTAMIDAAAIQLNPEGIRDERFAACELVWKYFFPQEEMPLAVSMLGSYDVWRWKQEPEWQQRQILAFQSAMRLTSMWPDDLEWSMYLESDSQVSDRVAQGTALLLYQQQMMNRMYNKCWIIRWKNYDWLVCNCQQTSSSYFEKHPDFVDVDGLIIFAQIAPHRWLYSLRHAGRKSDLVCGAIAKQYDGGGHPGAAGFKLDYKLRALS